MNANDFVLASIHTAGRNSIRPYTSPSGSPDEFLFMNLQTDIAYVGCYTDTLTQEVIDKIYQRALELETIKTYGGADFGAVFIPPQDIDLTLNLMDVTVFKVIIVDKAFEIVEVIAP